VRVMRRSGWFCVNSRNDDAFGSRLSRDGRSSDGGREIKTILYIFVAFQGISIVNSIIESRNAKTLELPSRLLRDWPSSSFSLYTTNTL
jgi:hypothetical protein